MLLTSCVHDSNDEVRSLVGDDARPTRSGEGSFEQVFRQRRIFDVADTLPGVRASIERDSPSSWKSFVEWKSRGKSRVYTRVSKRNGCTLQEGLHESAMVLT